MFPFGGISIRIQSVDCYHIWSLLTSIKPVRHCLIASDQPLWLAQHSQTLGDRGDQSWSSFDQSHFPQGTHKICNQQQLPWVGGQGLLNLHAWAMCQVGRSANVSPDSFPLVSPTTSIPHVPALLHAGVVHKHPSHNSQEEIPHPPKEESIYACAHMLVHDTEVGREGGITGAGLWQDGVDLAAMAHGRFHFLFFDPQALSSPWTWASYSHCGARGLWGERANNFPSS